MNATDTKGMLYEVGTRIKALREIAGYSVVHMADQTGLDVETYLKYEAGMADLPFTFIHNCARIFGVDITDLMEGRSANLRSYTVTRKGQATITAREEGISISNLAPMFNGKIAEPFWVTYSYSPELQNKPIHTTTHSGQEFDLILSGELLVRVGDHVEHLKEGDCIYYNSSTPHGMIATGGKDCTFCAVVLPGEETESEAVTQTVMAVRPAPQHMIYDPFVKLEEDGEGHLKHISFPNSENFNFAFDIVDALAEKKPDKLAMLYVDRHHKEQRFTFEDISRKSSRAANYFKALGIQKGDRVMLVLRRNWQFWVVMMALHKLGAVAIPATDQLLKKDYEYRFETAGVTAICMTAEGEAASHAEEAFESCPFVKTRIMCGGKREGWLDFDEEYLRYRSTFPRTDEAPKGDDPMVMFFSSGTTGYPKLAMHNHCYPLGHFITAHYWHNVEPDGLHFTISDTGWGKALWGKLYGQWMNEAAIFTFDFNRFDAHEILPMFKKYNITTFCAPPTMYRFLIREDLSKYDLSSIHYATTAGEALNPEVFNQFKKATGLSIMEAFGQTETTLVLGNFAGTTPKVGSMGKPSPLFDVVLVDSEGNPVKVGEPGEICIRTDKEVPRGLFMGYYRNDEMTRSVWHDGLYHTGDVAWQDEDGYFWYVSRADDVIKSSGYRIGPFEIESVIMELPYVLECGVSAAPDEIRGQVVKASVVLTRNATGTPELAKEIQDYVKKRTAPYKYPRIVVFRDELPKTISGKIQRNLL
ncbi:MAG: AMP-binding protein [Clostridia bacterium]|nr:AMP-binding protein [Clostridia bacterium]